MTNFLIVMTCRISPPPPSHLAVMGFHTINYSFIMVPLETVNFFYSIFKKNSTFNFLIQTIQNNLLIFLKSSYIVFTSLRKWIRATREKCNLRILQVKYIETGSAAFIKASQDLEIIYSRLFQTSQKNK